MANIDKWVAGSSLTLSWTIVTGTELNSLAVANFALGSVVVTNGTGLDLFMDLSGKITFAATDAVGDYIALYMLPLNQDGTTYGDGTGNGATLPDNKYYLDRWYASATGTTLSGQTNRIIIPPGSFKIGVLNGSVAQAFSGSAGGVYGRTYNINNNA